MQQSSSMKQEKLPRTTLEATIREADSQLLSIVKVTGQEIVVPLIGRPAASKNLPNNITILGTGIASPGRSSCSSQQASEHCEILRDVFKI